MNNYDLTSDEAAVFFEEANELLESLDRDLVALEQGSDDELVHRIFRAIHTLKGAAGSIGHDSMALLAHAAETVLERVRNHELAVTTPMANLLFLVVEKLRHFLEDVVEDRLSQVEIAEIVEQINGLLVTETESLPETLSSFPPVDTDAFALIEEGLDSGLNLLVVYAEADMTGIAPMARLLQVYMQMEQVAQIVVASPTGDELERGDGSGKLVLIGITDLERAEVEAELLNIFEISVLRVADLSNATHLLTKEDEEPAEGVPLAGEENKEEATEDAPLTAKVNERPVGPAPQRGAIQTSRSVRTSVERLDNLMNLAGELVMDRNRLFQIYEDLSHLLDDEQSIVLNDTITHLSSITDQIHDEIFKARMQPIEFIFNKFPRFVRQMCQELGKEVELVVTGQETEVDRSVIEQIGDPILHLVRNAIDHGVETVEERLAAGKSAKGQLTLSARSEESNIVVSITDDGRGVDAEKVKQEAVGVGLITEEEAAALAYHESIELIFAPGLSTVTQVSDLSGRGVGMDVVRNNIQQLNGSVLVDSVPDVGTTFELRLPLTLAIIPALLVEVHKQVFALPLPNVIEIFKLDPESVQFVRGKETAYVRGEVLPLVRLAHLFDKKISETLAETDDFRQAGDGKQNDPILPESGLDIGSEIEPGYVVSLSYWDTHLGVIVSNLLGKQDVVIKALGHPINNVRGLTGATLLGDGRIGLIVDIAALVSMATDSKTSPARTLSRV